MPILSEQEQVIRKAQAIQVLSMMATEQISQSAACAAVGISPKVYKKWIDEDDGAIDAIKDLVTSVKAQELGMITVAKAEILQRLLLRSVTEAIETKDLIAVVKLLDDMSDKISGQIGTDKPEDDALKYLDGPSTRDIASRSGARAGAKVNLKAKNDGSVDVSLPAPEDIIEGEFTPELSGEVEAGARL